MLESEKLAIAAHLHVLLRRKAGRVTDVEWMAKNREYALEVIRFTRAEPYPDLHEWADKLEIALLASRGAPPGTSTLPTLSVLPRASLPPVDPGPDSQLSAPMPLGAVTGSSRYVGRLR